MDGAIGTYIREECGRTLQSYRAQPNLIIEHANHEQDTARGGYADRQLFELVQNGADALSNVDGGEIELRLTSSHFYCADSGQGIDSDGVKALMFSYLSPKRGNDEIGRFGLGFKSVLGVSDSPEFFSRSGSFKFDRTSSQGMIERQLPGAAFERYPVLRLAMPIDPQSVADEDPILRDLMTWATNIVRLPLLDGAYAKLAKQADQFPPEFLLFVRHVERLDIRIDDVATRRSYSLVERDDEYHLSDEEGASRWKVFHRTHRLSENARADSRSLDDAREVPIWWATPLDVNNPAGHFWAFFPTTTPSLVPGIVNAPWKTNEDRQNLLVGVYNAELVSASAELIADNLHHLSTPEDPAKHLDALPRRVRQVDEGHTVKLSERLFELLFDRPLFPDMSGELRRFEEVKFPPEVVMRRRRGFDKNLDAALTRWYGLGNVSKDWLHQSATRVLRWPFVERLCDPFGQLKTDNGIGTPEMPLAKWLEALVDGAPTSEEVDASTIAILVGADLPKHADFNDVVNARVTLTQSNSWVELKGDVYLPTDGFSWAPERMVHESLSNNAQIRQALAFLGVKEASAESRYQLFLESLLGSQSDVSLDLIDGRWEYLWRSCRGVDPQVAADMLTKYGHWRNRLRVRTVSGEWQPMNSALLPGIVVPGDGSRDERISVDLLYHREDEMFLRYIRMSDRPEANWPYTTETDFVDLMNRSVDEFQEHGRSRIGQTAQANMLRFADTIGVGPIQCLVDLSDEGSAAFVDTALQNLATFDQWEMRHSSRREYGSMETRQPIAIAIERHGKIRNRNGFVAFSDALGENPKSAEAQQFLINHPNAELIRRTFDLHDPPKPRFAPINSSPPVHIVEDWPSLTPYLAARDKQLNIVRCDDILEESGDPFPEASVKHEDSIYIVRMDRQDELNAITIELDIRLTEAERRVALTRTNREKIKVARNAVKIQKDDEARLLQAVGENALLAGLPEALTVYYGRNGHHFEGNAVAKAAISTYHTGALRVYRHALAHLDPPKQWAGSSQAIQFVTELGFSPDWAGARSSRRDPFLEVSGPIVLPPLHDYQNIVANKLRQMLRSSASVLSDRRAMISLPTGSGKTRVTVEGIVASITEDAYEGGVLWVADRDELCEQAVQAWQEVWRAKGRRDQILRISRMWEGQPPPLATNENHVVVASVQTLSSKLNRGNADYDFLREFKLVVFDEAHRSVAPTYTSAMDELGFRTRSGVSEPLLLGLTATPYRGYSESETRWLASRYGHNRLDRSAFLSEDPNLVMRQLQEMMILARVTHMEIEGGSFSLYGSELAEVERTPWLPNSVENRIARDTERTERIIQAYKNNIGIKSDVWPTLIFATSVEHAQTLAAILTADGISARAVSGGTDRYTRRRVVEQFRAGELRVLVNYGVFREGFDAPKTRAIIVARPVYSPNLYFQMIGRGLRGVKNGGNERCLILDVRDNVLNFDRNLAFTELDWLWD